MIDFKNVSKKYSNNVVAINDASFHIEDGEFVFLTGASGAGKSTIIKLILKEIDPDRGEIYLNGKDISRVSKRMVPKIRSDIGVVFQDFRLLKNRNIYENIEFVLDIWGMSRSDKKKRIREVLELVNLYDRRKDYPNQLSGGEQQRVSMARALAVNPKILIADEPTGNLDPDTSWEIMDFLEKVNQSGTTVIMSTHSREIVDRLQKRVIVLEYGRVIRDSVGGYDEGN